MVPTSISRQVLPARSTNQTTASPTFLSAWPACHDGDVAGHHVPSLLQYATSPGIDAAAVTPADADEPRPCAPPGPARAIPNTPLASAGRARLQ